MSTRGRSPKSRIRTRLTGLLAGLALLGIVVGLPLALLAVGAAPVPHALPSLDSLRSGLSTRDDGTLALALVTLVGWAAWAFLSLAILLELVARLRGVTAPHLPGLRLPQSAARGLVTTAMLLFIAAPLPLPPGPGGGFGPPPAALIFSTAPATPTVATPVATAVGGRAWITTAPPVAPRPLPTTAAAAAGPGTDVAPAAVRAHTVRTHTVRRGETLWSIARDHLGAGHRYGQIAAINADVLGHRPGFLTPGWVLNLPATAGPGDHDGPGSRSERTVTAQAGDTLSAIARDELGDAARYREIFDASQATAQPGGAHLRDPDLIDVGWHLTIPAPAPAPGADPGPRHSPSHGRGHSGPAPAVNGALPPQSPPTSMPPPILPAPTADALAPSPQLSAAQNPAPATPTTPTPTPAGAAATAVTPTTGQHTPSGPTPAGAPTAAADTPTTAWLLTGLTGAGAVLAASMLLLLRVRRRAQFRARRPGRTIAVPGPALAPVEKTAAVAGSQSAPTVELMDELLRRLAARQAHDGHTMPALAAVELTPQGAVLHLSQAQDLPPPWRGRDDRTRWTCPTSTDLDDVGPHEIDQPAPYPLLVTIGSSDDDAVWLINCEDQPAITITGDPTYGRDFARYLAAEIACNPWSRDAAVDCLGVAGEIAPMNPQRVRYHESATSSAAYLAEAAIAGVIADAVATLERADAVGHDVATARACQLGDDTWPSRLLLIEARGPRTPALADLLRLLEDHRGATATCVVVAAGHNDTGEPSAGDPSTGDLHPASDGPSRRHQGVILDFTDDGRVKVPHAGLDLVAVGLTSDEAQGCAALLAHSEDLHDVEIPHDPHAEQGWRSYADEAGALRPEHTMARDHADDATPDAAGEGGPAEPSASVLPGPDRDYLRNGATTPADLAVLAPRVPLRVRGDVEDTDADLDADLAAWFADDCDLPRLTLLGPVGARTRGDALAVANRKGYFIEILAYLATRPHGATPAQLAEDFGITVGRARTGIATVRDWLGVNPRTGRKHLPDARQSPAGKARGVGVYQVDGLLVDVDLFRRLRLRGEVRGADGITDLCRALSLVGGRPFDHLRTSGWSWLHEGDRLDQHMLCAVVDVAHLVATASLADGGDLARARASAELAALAAPDEEIPRLDLAAVTAAEGHAPEAQRILREDVCNRFDDGDAPTELSERTAAIIASHDWLARGKSAS